MDNQNDRTDTKVQKNFNSQNENELIKITERNDKQVVSARELYEFLESKRGFSNWINEKIEKYEFVENEDFEVLNKFTENPLGGRPLIEYALTLDCAKELCMVEGNKKGKIARRYFIRKEEELREIKKVLLQNDTPELIMARGLIASQIIIENQKQQLHIAEGKAELLENEHKILAPKAKYTDNVLQSVNTYTSTQIAKELGLNSAEQLHKKLYEISVMFKQSGQWLLFANYCNKGYTKTRTHEYTNNETGITQSSSITVWTETGRKFLHELLNNTLKNTYLL